MDADVLCWILDFLVRSSIPIALLKKIIAVIPFPGIDFSLEKAFLLRIIQVELSKASVSETLLEILEMVEELDRNNGMAIMDSMRAAYCAVAVESTVKYFAVCPENSEECVKAVTRIWRRRISCMEESERRSELIGEEFKQWRNEIETVVRDLDARERLGNVNTRKDASNKLRGYLKEAWATMGPGFLESIERLMKVNNFPFSAAEGEVGLSCEANLDEESGGNVVGRTRNAPEIHRCYVGGNLVKVDDGASVRLDQVCSLENGTGFNNGTVKMIAAQGTRDNQTGQQVEDMDINKTKGFSVSDLPANEVSDLPANDGARVRLDQGFGPENGTGFDNVTVKMINVQGTRDNQTGRQVEDMDINKTKDFSVSDVPANEVSDVPANEVSDVPANDRTRVRLDQGCSRENETSFHNVAVKMIDVQGTRDIQTEQQVEDMDINKTKGFSVSDLPANEVAEIQKANLLHKQKQTAYRKRCKGIKINTPEEEEADEDSGSSCGNNDILPNSEVKKVQEALISSSLQLQALVKDPLPDALRISEIARSELEKRNINEEPPIESKRNVPGVSLMERNNTAHAYEWDDSINESPKGSSNCSSQLHAPKSNKNKVSPLKKYANENFTKRRKVKKWSLIEEDTLRTGVQKFGAGNWKLILNSYRDIFEERTEVDLKDKWRNMTRYNSKA